MIPGHGCLAFVPAASCFHYLRRRERHLQPKLTDLHGTRYRAQIEENLQYVPMSVQALSGDELNRAGITRLYELQFAVPGLVVNTVGMFGAGFSLRGIADSSSRAWR